MHLRYEGKMSKLVRVRYRCDSCGNKATESQTWDRGSQWLTVRCRNLHQTDQGDLRYACSYVCARKLLADMMKNLKENDERCAD